MRGRKGGVVVVSVTCESGYFARVVRISLLRASLPQGRPEAPRRAAGGKQKMLYMREYGPELVRCLVLKLCQKIRLYGNL